MTACQGTSQCGAPMGMNPSAYVGPKAFIDASAALGDAKPSKGWGGLAAFDYDNDGDIDLYLTGRPGFPNRLLKNDGQANFTDVTDESGAGLSPDNCMACGVGDLNNDGWLDLLVTRQRFDLPSNAAAGSILLLNNGPNAGGVVTFRALTPAESGFDSSVPAMGISVGDLDNDGLLDLIVARYDMNAFIGILIVPVYDSQPNEIWRCTGIVGGVPQYQKVPGAGGAEGTLQHGASEQTQNQTFVPGCFVAHPTDVDGDGRLDLLYLHDIPGGIDYYHNDGNFTFSARQMDTLNQHGGWMGLAAGDYDADGDVDYFVTNTGCDFYQVFPDGTIAETQVSANGSFFHKLLRNDAGTLVDVAGTTPVSPSSVLPPVNAFHGSGLQATEFGFGATWIDADNRGILDLYWGGDLMTFILRGLVLNAHGVGRFLENNGDGSFKDQTADRGLFDIQPDRTVNFGEQDAARAVVAIDLNGDGFQDLVVTNSTYFGGLDPQHRVFLNRGVAGAHWLTVRLRGTTSNRFGIGSRVRVTSGGRIWAAEISTNASTFSGVQPEAHFGLGSPTSVDELRVIWPSGQTSVMNNVAADQVLIVTEP